MKTRPNLVILITAGVITLAIGISVGLALWKYSPKPNKPLTPDQSPVQISSYDDCVKAKSSLIQESYPTICVTAAGQRFIQPIPTDSVSCGGWDTSGEIVCECSGKLVKPSCSPNGVCDGQTYLCEGQCWQCCYKGFAENNQYPKCQN